MHFRVFTVLRTTLTFCHILAFASSQDTCPVIRYKGSFRENDHVKDHALFGHSYKNLTTNIVQACFGACVSDCRCLSYQLNNTRCELIDEDRHTAPDSFKATPGYKHYELKQSFFGMDKQTGCQTKNGCCQTKPCLNGGTCIEVFHDVKVKFKCFCKYSFGGKVCQKNNVPFTSASYAGRRPGIYPITTPTGGQQQVFCDTNSEPGIIWTLIESFTLANKERYKYKAFSDNFPWNENHFNWLDYRLSKSSMENIKTKATHWRATCNYNTDGLIKTDYIRGLLSDVDIITYEGSNCVKIQYANVRGIHCSNCTVHLRQQVSSRHPYLDTIKGYELGCQLDIRNGGYEIPGSGKWCDNFGYYSITNSNHRCSALQSSTTQWWLGTQV